MPSSARAGTRHLGVGLALAGILWPGLARAQTTREVNEQAQFWTSLNTTARLSERWGVIADVHVRRTDFVQDPSFYFLRAGANAWLRESFTVALGFAHMWKAPTCGDCTTWTDEDRVYLQAQYTTKLGGTAVVHRFRNELRWQEPVANDVLTGETALSDRARYLASFTIPVAQNPKVPALVLSDEVLLQFGSKIVYNTFDQNRLFAGIKQKLGAAWSFDLGYMLVVQQKSSGYQYDLNHTLRVFFYFTPDLRGGRPVHQPAGNEE